MTCLDAAYTILKTAGQPLHFEESTQRALAQKLIAPLNRISCGWKPHLRPINHMNSDRTRAISSWQGSIIEGDAATRRCSTILRQPDGHP